MPIKKTYNNKAPVIFKMVGALLFITNFRFIQRLLKSRRYFIIIILHTALGTPPD